MRATRGLWRAALVVALLAASCSSGSLSEGSASARGASPWTYVEATDADGAALYALEALRLQLVVQGGCSTVGGREARRQFLAALPEVAIPSAERAFDALGEAVAACGIDESAWAAGLVEAAQHLADVAIALDSPDSQPPNEPTTILAGVAATVVTQYDHIHAVLNPAGPAQRSAHWFGPAESIVFAEMRALRAAGEPPSIILAGDSVMKHGIDVPTLRDAGLDVYNAAIQAGAPPVQATMLVDVLALTPQVDTIVWDVSTHWMFGRSCRESEIYTAVTAARNSVFSGVEAADEEATLDLVLGPDPESPIYALDGVRSLDAYGLGEQVTYGDGPVLTGTINGPGPRDQAERRYEDEPSICRTALEVIGDALDAWSGVQPEAQLIVVLPPMSDELAGLHPDGRGGHAPVAAELESAVVARGATFVDLSNTVPEDGYYDIVHTNEIGRALFTNALLEVLT